MRCGFLYGSMIVIGATDPGPAITMEHSPWWVIGNISFVIYLAHYFRTVGPDARVNLDIQCYKHINTIAMTAEARIQKNYKDMNQRKHELSHLQNITCVIEA